MKNSQKGFVNILVVVIALVVIGVAGYFVISQKVNQPATINDNGQNIGINNADTLPTQSTGNNISEPTQTPAKASVNPPVKNQPSNSPIVDNKKETNTADSKYCLNGQCWKDNSATTFQELFGGKLNAVASNDSSVYGGATVGGFYFDNKWLTTCEPLKQKVNELISGKSTNQEKILAIANWVTKSRPYGSLPAGKVNSICELFSANGGICLDAASLTTAMLRFANIPARVVDPKTDGKLAAHEYTAAFLDGKWVAVDSTFGGGTREIFEPTSILSSLNYHAFDKPREIIIPAFNNPYAIEFTYYLADGIFTLTHTRSDLVTENGTKKSESYGTITYVKPRYFSQDIGYVGNATLIAKNLQCDYYECRKLSGVETKILLPQEYTMINAKKMIHVVDGKIAQEIDNQFVTNADLRKDYYAIATYPAGQYRFVYESSTSGKAVAYYDFELQQSGNIVVTSDKLMKGDGANNTEFNNFISYLKGVK